MIFTIEFSTAVYRADCFFILRIIFINRYTYHAKQDAVQEYELVTSLEFLETKSEKAKREGRRGDSNTYRLCAYAHHLVRAPRSWLEVFLFLGIYLHLSSPEAISTRPFGLVGHQRLSTLESFNKIRPIRLQSLSSGTSTPPSATTILPSYSCCCCYHPSTVCHSSSTTKNLES